MIVRLVIEAAAASRSLAERLGAGALAREFPTVTTTAQRPARAGACVTIDAAAWGTGAIDFDALDRRLDALAGEGHGTLVLEGEPRDPARTALEALTRARRLIGRRNEESASPSFDRLLRMHRALHDVDLPLVRADYDHVLDTWQWTLRPSPSAGLAEQAAAPLHDVERLATEATARREHLAPDYADYKDAHARSSGGMARDLLASGLGLEPAVVERAARLVARHERPGNDPDLALLNDADALSLFSLNSPGFVDYYGEEHARRKMAFSLRRLGPEARARLGQIRLRADVKAMLESALGERGAAEEHSCAS